MKVAHLVPRLDPLDSEPLLLALLKYRGAGFAEPFVASPGLIRDASKLPAAGCEVYTETEPPQVIARLARADLIHAHCPSARWGARLLDPLRRTGRPFLFTLYGVTDAPVALPALCICTSVAVHEDQSRTTSRCRRVDIGIDLERFAPPAARPPRERVVLTRTGPPLRQAEYFWRAMADVLSRHPDVELRLVGGRGTGNQRVRAMDARADLAAVLAETDLLVATPQAGEGNDTYGVMAAMAMGVPAVLSDTADMRACAVAGETALLVPDGDAPALVAAVESLLANEGLRRQLGAAARERAVQRFDVRDRVRRYEEIYTALLDGARLGRGPTSEPKGGAGLRRWWRGLRLGTARRDPQQGRALRG